MIEFINVSKDYLQTNIKIKALQSISLTIKQSEFFGLVGTSGSGKSTLLRLINGLEKPTSGELFIEEQSLTSLKKSQKREMVQQMGMIFQHFNLLQNKTVAQNVALSLKVQGIKDTSIVLEMLKFVGMEELCNKYPSQLSGGQKQRVAIARALATKPKILLCDEPTSALDEHNSVEIMALLKKIQVEYGTTIVFVSHELELIKAWCDRAGIMENGEILSVVEVVHQTKTTQTDSYYERALEYLT
ncbi:methionine ABC transporter ATP-binding protein [Vagococcus silagei]|uniref:ATP-binding cassette domain-containing protein n=1 Tax=Vagococcus silagei TaxID=2508885 RepID=A0A4S3B1T6_9ENTE|nr:ATP-binding cassette domain-containing protein [Vagococcus silagei]THB60207.1 ATP-binding cassette domain-containing protein [Vagococcus silagei]